jgi:SPP1 gp7 family putative phage head morphogenesis protein
MPRRNPRTPKRPPPDPRTERAAYVRFMASHWAVWADRVRALPGVRNDAAGDLIDVEFGRVFDRRAIETFMRRIGRAVDRRVDRYLRKVVKLPATTFDPTGAVDGFVARNVDLITNLGADNAAKIRELVQNANATGQRHEELAPLIEHAIDVGKSRALLIARDQTTKLNGELQAAHQQAAGVRRFRWSTSKDDAVRPSHKVLEGSTFEWSSPPIVDGEPAIPGQPIQCRCTAIPELSF